MGFDTINTLAKKHNIEVTKKKFKGLVGTGIIENEKVLLLKPQTYMNLSGDSLIEAMDYYNLDTQDLIVIYDDMDIEKGMIKIRKKGGSGTHNGMKSIVNMLNSQNFPRIRVGIGKPDDKNDMISYVIGHIPEKERKILKTGVDKAKNAIIEILKNGIDKAMNKFN